ncbi:hypothetical protein HMPREF2826_02305 [Olsenella sp. HMSC062G07]|nr:hypothetical protein HMPREF2826_02305 [Olsenella sp. HMSC062G07]
MWGLNPRERGSESVDHLLGRFLSRGLGRSLSANQRAAVAWRDANGDVERMHTCGVYLRKPPNAALPPVMGVYVDSHARLMDWNTNREIYLARLAAAGLELSGLEFRLARNHRPPTSPRPTSPAATASGSLSMQDEERIRRRCAELPPGLRERLAQAMRDSLHRDRTPPPPAS